MPTIAELLKPLGYATGQFGKNHLGDRNEFLPTVHGFDEFFGNLYHLNAEEEPETPDYPPTRIPKFNEMFGPRGVLHCWATDKDDPTDEPRWGKVGKQKIEDTGPLTSEAHGDVSTTSSGAAVGLHRAPAQTADKPFFVLVQHHAHAPAHPSKPESIGQAGPRAVALPRHHDRPRQERRADARPAR